MPGPAGLSMPECRMDSRDFELQSRGAQGRKQTAPYEGQSEAAAVQVHLCKAAQILPGNKTLTAVAEVQGATEMVLEWCRRGMNTLTLMEMPPFVLLSRRKVLK